jgi:hypothetical protein
LQNLRRNYKDTDNDDSASAPSSDSGNISAEVSDDEVKRQLEKEASDSGDDASESEDSTEAREKLEKKDRQARRFPNPEAEKAKEAKKKKSKKNTRKDSSSSDSVRDRTIKCYHNVTLNLLAAGLRRRRSRGGIAQNFKCRRFADRGGHQRHLGLSGRIEPLHRFAEGGSYPSSPLS